MYFRYSNSTRRAFEDKVADGKVDGTHGRAFIAETTFNASRAIPSTPTHWNEFVAPHVASAPGKILFPSIALSSNDVRFMY